MRSVRMVLCGIALLAALRADDIFGRVRSVLTASGEGDRAAAELASNHYVQVIDVLARAKPSTSAEQAELFSVEGAVEFLAGNMREASQDFLKASDLAPLRDGDRFTLAMALIRLGDSKRSAAILTELAEKNPQYAIYPYWLGKIYYDQRRYPEAVAQLQKSVQLDSTSARVWDSLGLAFDMQGNLDQALSALQTGANLNRAAAHPSAWPPHDLGFLLLRLERFMEADVALRESLRYDPHFAQAHYHLARTLEKEGKDTEAITEYTSALSTDSASPDACYSLASLYKKLHRDQEASAMFAEYRKRKELVAPSESEPR